MPVNVQNTDGNSDGGFKLVLRECATVSMLDSSDSVSQRNLIDTSTVSRTTERIVEQEVHGALKSASNEHPKTNYTVLPPCFN